MAEEVGGGGWSDGVGVVDRLVGGATNIPQEFSQVGSIYMVFCSLHIKKWSFQFNYSPLMTSLFK